MCVCVCVCVCTLRCNRGLLRLLEEGIDPKGAGRGLYFSYNADITQVTQRAAALALQDPKVCQCVLVRVRCIPVCRMETKLTPNTVSIQMSLRAVLLAI